MNISEAAKLMDVTAVTLRYYERVGLIPPVTRKNGGVRDFQQEDLNWIEFIKCMRSSGLSVESLTEYTTLYQQGDATLERRKQILQEERDNLAAKYEEIGATLQRLDGKIADYDNGKFQQAERRLPEWTEKEAMS
ncbi:MerR family transcriptional regulator [Enterococcus sp. 669A]|uniref:MerR family transcriptional regulator n=1 Tax=Candidatus Enterococcus moelleringii TaxID=2815325 RepID=A0ABS3LFA8_9ENTE|nr:MerR family transcriptional regulator [Enterococcus sp. 669A]MBO1307411.1 MerR family transcriptional regulator [Enterococcus sp. 669A]